MPKSKLKFKLKFNTKGKQLSGLRVQLPHDRNIALFSDDAGAVAIHATREASSSAPIENRIVFSKEGWNAVLDMWHQLSGQVTQTWVYKDTPHTSRISVSVPDESKQQANTRAERVLRIIGQFGHASLATVASTYLLRYGSTPGRQHRNRISACISTLYKRKLVGRTAAKNASGESYHNYWLMKGHVRP